MHAARLMHSPRLLRVLAVLADGREHTTRDIIREAQVCAVNSCIAELRANGAGIVCRVETDSAGQRRFLYRLASPPDLVRPNSLPAEVPASA